MDLADLQALLARIAGVRVVAVGDLMVDRFVHGAVARISAEAPIPVMARQSERVMLGAVGNVARNVAALGGEAALVGVIGKDAAGREAKDLIAAEPRIEGYLITDPERPTTIKTRFVSAGQQLLRVDEETTAPIDGEVESQLVRTLLDAARGARAILVSDYGKGVVTPAVIAAARQAAAREGAMLIVDSKARSFARYGAVDVVKPNAAELAFATDLPTDTDAEVEAALARALELSECRSVIVTRAAKGMSVGVRGQPVVHHRRPPPEVFDTMGAGDILRGAFCYFVSIGRGFVESLADAANIASESCRSRGTREWMKAQPALNLSPDPSQ